MLPTEGGGFRLAFASLIRSALRERRTGFRLTEHLLDASAFDKPSQQAAEDQFTLGSEVEVRYDPSNPDRSYITPALDANNTILDERTEYWLVTVMTQRLRRDVLPKRPAILDDCRGAAAATGCGFFSPNFGMVKSIPSAGGPVLDVGWRHRQAGGITLKWVPLLATVFAVYLTFRLPSRGPAVPRR